MEVTEILELRLIGILSVSKLDLHLALDLRWLGHLCCARDEDEDFLVKLNNDKSDGDIFHNPKAATASMQAERRNPFVFR
ncbi:receptor-like protein 12 [Pyrus ussuriensis x Pyrus communis]|uniref:Receptor-like protein 12 n=1 Tax=Pyrus ussuriensis x Pyrus communis TaxID=2448454 RepID=A0A5N5HWR8_9ROSA|nr:receptor-like protein 12 [Pyrus ussuriensis x Pyrus communis]